MSDSILNKLFGTVVGGATAAVNPAAGVTGLVSDVIDHIAMTPEQKAQLQEALQANQLQLAGLQAQYDAQILQAVNATMQAEVKSPGWFSRDWRPFWGWMSGIAFAFEIFCIGSILIRDGLENIATAIPSITQLVSATIPLWGIALAVQGIVAWHQGQADVVAAGNAKG